MNCGCARNCARLTLRGTRRALAITAGRTGAKHALAFGILCFEYCFSSCPAHEPQFFNGLAQCFQVQRTVRKIPTPNRLYPRAEPLTARPNFRGEGFMSLRSCIRIRWLVVEDAAAAYKNAGERENGSQEAPKDLGKHAEPNKV